VGRNVEIGPGEVAKVRLSNGATLLVREDRAVPLVSVRAAAKGGLLAETEATSGITHLAGELLVRGTSRYGAEQLTEELDAMAGGISGVSGKNSLGLRGDFLEERWERGLELFASCLLEATFEPAELERERKTQLEDIASRRDQLASICIEQFGATLWREHPYRLPILGTEASVSGFTREQVMKAARDQLHPEGLVISVVGAVDIPRTIEAVEKRIGAVAPHADARRPEWPAREAPPEAPRAARTVKNREQAHLVIGFPGVDLFDERRWVIEVISSVLGGQGGRLFLELRDKQSLCYSVSAFSQEGLDPGYFAVYIGTAQDKLQTAEAGMRRELEKLAAEGVTAAEVERAKRYLLGAHEIGLQRASARSSTMALNEAYGLGYDEHLRHESKIAPIDVTRVNAVLAELIDFERAVTSIVHAG